MLKILNISNHKLTAEQVEDLVNFYDCSVEVMELPEALKSSWGQLQPTNYKTVCDDIETFMVEQGIKDAHLAGYAPAVVYLCGKHNARYIYSHSIRNSIEVEENGTVIKKQIFRHSGWFEY